MRIILYAMGLFLIVLGAVELIRWLSFRLFRGPDAEGELALVVIPAGAEDCELLIRAAAQRVEWMALKPKCRLIYLDKGDAQASQIARRLRAAHPELEVITPDELPKSLSGKH